MVKALECEYTIEGNGKPLFLIHGIGAARDTWRFVIPELVKDFTVISYDLRGHGESQKPTEEFGLDELVADLELLRQKIGIEKAHFAGHSLGGMIGPAYARLYPERVHSLGILSTAAGRTQEDSDKVWAVVHAMEEKGVSNVLPALKDRWYTDGFLDKHPDIVERRLKQVINTDPEIFMNVFRIYAGTEMLPWLHEVKVPSLVLTGEKDGGCNPRLNQLIHDELANSELVILPELKHSILLEDGATVAKHLIRFIQKLTN
ncbi:alpha/beta fold hydrolase [Curvivirga sp.]|uniref:alpha/beta fold hydrolase n=1 Tax=Curvivirga sp. TaxID=2856848 RepID=UPI003B5941BB